MHRRGPCGPTTTATSARAPRCRLSQQQRGVHTQAHRNGSGIGGGSGSASTEAAADRRQLPSPSSSCLLHLHHLNHNYNYSNSSSNNNRHPALRRGAPSRLPPPLRALGGQFDNLPPIPTRGDDDEDEGEEEEEEEEFFSRPLSSSSEASTSSSSSSSSLPPRLRPKRVRFRSFADDVAARDPPLPPCPVFGDFERRLFLDSTTATTAATAAASDEGPPSPPPPSPRPLVLVRPLLQPEIPDAASLLTDGFAASMGYPARYRRLLRNHIVAYLRSHSRLSPAAVVLSARFVDGEEEGEENEEKQEQRQEQQQQRDFSDVAAAAAASLSSSSAPSSPSSPFSSPSPSSDGEREREGDEEQLLPPPPPLLPALQSSPPPLPPLDIDQSPAPPPRPRLLPGVLAGSVEVSLSSSTRTRSLTLNPPDDAAYLCNMAVRPSLRGRGVGRALLSAAADAARVAGAAELFLHLRVKDAEGPAGRLYARGGFVEAGRDSGLLSLFNADRRLLLRKKL